MNFEVDDIVGLRMSEINRWNNGAENGSTHILEPFDIFITEKMITGGLVSVRSVRLTDVIIVSDPRDLVHVTPHEIANFRMSTEQYKTPQYNIDKQAMKREIIDRQKHLAGIDKDSQKQETTVNYTCQTPLI